MRLQDSMISVLRHAGRAESTIGQYCFEVRRFFRWYGRNRPLLVRREDVLRYLGECGRRSVGYRKLAQAGLRAFFVTTLNRPEVVANIPWPRVPTPLRDPPRLAQVQVVLAAVDDLRCQAALRVIVASGLRISEVCALQIEDVVVGRDDVGKRADVGVLRVRCGKGGKGRLAPLPETLLHDLRDYFRQVRPKTWLFPNVRGSGPIDPLTIRRALTLACSRCSMPRWTPHLLRHGYATAMLEAGADLPTLRRSMGHKRIETTAIYMHVRRDRLAMMPDLLAKSPPT